MLSYQHIYHAGCLADVHKHALISCVLNRLIQKPKPLTYMETHAGRGIYDLTAPESLKTEEAQAGINRAQSENWFPSDHPYMFALRDTQKRHGFNIYPGSPAIARYFLRETDSIHLMELHPQEYIALKQAIPQAHIHHRDGYEGVLALSPPTPRRGVVLIDPSYEVKSEYTDIPDFLAKLHRKWAQAVIMVWYPILPDNRHQPMLDSIRNMVLNNTTVHEVRFRQPPTAMLGSGMILINTPFGFDKDMAFISNIFEG